MVGGCGWMGVSLFLGPFVSQFTSRREGDWSTHDIGLEEIAFPPRPWWSKDGGCKRELSVSDPRACQCPCVHRGGGGQCETLKGDGVWYSVPSWSWTRC